MKLYLIRHAQSDNNARPEHLRVEDPGLTEIGQRQARQLADWFARSHCDRLITSPFRRALETAAPQVQATGIKAEVWAALHEQGGCYRGWEPERYEGRPGMTADEIRAAYPHFEVETGIDGQGWWRCQPYESEAAARQRATQLLERTRQTFAASDATICYIMHADFKHLMMETLFPQLAWLATIHGPVYNTSVTCCVITPTATKLVCYNAITHLDGGHLTS